MFRKLTLSLSAAALVASALLFSGCSPQSNHPNQLNRFDGAAYDSLVLAHGSLVSLRSSVINRYPALAPKFNNVAEAYRAAVVAYSIYRSNSTIEVTTSTALHNLTLALILLEGELQASLSKDSGQLAPDAPAAGSVSSRAQTAYSPSELLTVLEVAATVASSIPAAQKHADAAQAILAATGQALLEWRTVASAPIDLAVLSPIDSI